MSFAREVKAIIRPFLPPIVADQLRRIVGAIRSDVTFEGDYGSWQAARARAQGYERPSILEKTLAAAAKVRDGEAAYERDTVLFDHIERSYPALAGLLYAASVSRGRLSVLDFGGALGSSYREHCNFLRHLEGFRWSIVEQRHFVEAGKKDFQNEELRFYETAEECVEAERPNVLLLSSVLQYLEDPQAFIRGIPALRVGVVIVDRTPVMHGSRDRLTVQTVPPHIYDASYPCWIFGEDALNSALGSLSKSLDRFEAYPGTRIELGGAFGHYAGWILRIEENL